MPLILAALVVGALTLPYFGAPIEIDFDRDLTLAIISGYLLLQGLLSLRGPKVIIEKDDKAEDEASALRTQLDAIAGDYREMKEREKKLQQAIEDSTRRLELEKQKSQGQDKTNAEVVNLLSLFQTKGRFIDFLMQDITPYSDAQVGSVARFVHQGCSGILKEHFDVEAIYKGAEGDSFTVKQDTDQRNYRLIGRITDSRPLKGVVVHKGWRSKKVQVPRVVGETGEPYVIAPAEVEIN